MPHPTNSNSFTTPWARCDICKTNYDSSSIELSHKHNHYMVKCSTCRLVYDRNNEPVHRQHQTETICEVCMGIYSIDDPKELAKHKNEESCRICSIIYNRLIEPSHELTAHPTQRFCNICKVVVPEDIYKKQHIHTNESVKTEPVIESTKTNIEPTTTKPASDYYVKCHQCGSYMEPSVFEKYHRVHNQEVPSSTQDSAVTPPIPPPEIVRKKRIETEKLIEMCTDATVKVDVPDLMKRIYTFFKNGEPKTYLEPRKVTIATPPVIPPLTSLSSTTSSLPSAPGGVPPLPPYKGTGTTIINGVVVRNHNSSSAYDEYNKTMSDLNTAIDANVQELGNKLNENFNLKVVIVKSNITTHKIYPVNGFITVERLKQRVIKDERLDDSKYWIRVVYQGKQKEEPDVSINTFLQSTEDIIYCVVHGIKETSMTLSSNSDLS